MVVEEGGGPAHSHYPMHTEDVASGAGSNTTAVAESSTAKSRATGRAVPARYMQQTSARGAGHHPHGQGRGEVTSGQGRQGPLQQAYASMMLHPASAASTPAAHVRSAARSLQLAPPPGSAAAPRHLTTSHAAAGGHSGPGGGAMATPSSASAGMAATPAALAAHSVAGGGRPMQQQQGDGASATSGAGSAVELRRLQLEKFRQEREEKERQAREAAKAREAKEAADRAREARALMPPPPEPRAVPRLALGHLAGQQGQQQQQGAAMGGSGTARDAPAAAARVARPGAATARAAAGGGGGTTADPLGAPPPASGRGQAAAAPVVPKLRLGEVAALQERAAHAPLPKDEVWEAAHVPLPMTERDREGGDAFALVTPLTGRMATAPLSSRIAKSPLRSGLAPIPMAPLPPNSARGGRSPAPSHGGGGRGGAAAVEDDLSSRPPRDQLRLLEQQDMFWRLLTIKLDRALAERNRKADEQLAAAALLVAHMQRMDAAARGLRAQRDAAVRQAQLVAGLMPLLERWMAVEGPHGAATREVVAALRNALTSLPLANGAALGLPPREAAQQLGAALQAGHRALQQVEGALVRLAGAAAAAPEAEGGDPAAGGDVGGVPTMAHLLQQLDALLAGEVRALRGVLAHTSELSAGLAELDSMRLTARQAGTAAPPPHGGDSSDVGAGDCVDSAGPSVEELIRLGLDMAV